MKPAAEMSLLYGNHVLKSGLGRITESTPTNTGVVLFSMTDVPLGFGVTAKSTAECRSMEPSGIVVLHQADVGKACRLRCSCFTGFTLHPLGFDELSKLSALTEASLTSGSATILPALEMRSIIGAALGQCLNRPVLHWR